MTLSRTQRFPELSRLLATLPVERFLAEYWEREVFHASHGPTSEIARLTSLAEIDALLTDRPHRHPDIMLANAANPVNPEDYTEGNDRIDPVLLARRFIAGSSIVVNHLDEGVPRVRELCARLETELGIEVQANTYLTPPGAQGFAIHYDSHDVIVVQCAGTKLWKLYDAPTLPMRGERFDRAATKVGEQTLELTLQPGDVLYIPRGRMHGAVAESDAYSLHVTVGFHAVRWSEVLVEGLAVQALADIDLRKGLPLGALVDPPDDAETEILREELRAKMAKLVDAIRWDELRPRLSRRFVDSRRDRVSGIFRDAMTELTLETPLAVREGVHVTSKDDGDDVVLTVNGRSTRWPKRASSVIAEVITAGTFTLSAIDPSLDAPGRITLGRRLIAEGLVRIVR